MLSHVYIYVFLIKIYSGLNDVFLVATLFLEVCFFNPTLNFAASDILMFVFSVVNLFKWVSD